MLRSCYVEAAAENEHVVLPSLLATGTLLVNGILIEIAPETRP